jgi:hypothetical protein
MEIDNPLSLRFVCPHCNEQHSYQLPPEDLIYKKYQTISCANCHKSFHSRIVSIRSKKSRGDRKLNAREFDIRVINPDTSEDLIQFVNYDYDDLQLSSKDRVAFIYAENMLRVVQNYTVNTYWKIKPKRECYLATCVYGESSQETEIFRNFRDEVLLPSAFLSTFVYMYYEISPFMVRYLGDKAIFRFVIKSMLGPILNWISIFQTRNSRMKY